MTLLTARIISFLSYPYIIIPPGVFFIFLKQSGSTSYAFMWSIIAVVFVMVILAFELIGLKLGMFSNFDISRRKQRTSFYTFLLLLLSAGIVTAFALQVSREIISVGIAAFIGIALMFIVNRKVKASLHVASISALLLTVAFLYGSYFYAMLLFIPLIAWSRVKTKKHKISETVAGGILGIFITVLSYAMVQYIQ